MGDDVVFNGAIKDTTSRNTSVAEVASVTINANYTKHLDILFDLKVTNSFTMNGSGVVNGGNTPNKLIIPNTSSTFTWSAGTMGLQVDFGSPTTQPTGSIQGSALKATNVDTKFVIYGTLTWIGTGDIEYISAAANLNALTIKSSGTFDIQTNNDFTLHQDASADVRINVEGNGNFLKTGGTGTTVVNWKFQNLGNFEMNTGVTSFSSEAANMISGRTRLNGGDLSATGAGGFEITGGLLDGVGTITGNVYNGRTTAGFPAAHTTAGTVHPGVGSNYGTLTIIGNYSQNPNGRLKIEVTNNASNYGKLIVDDNGTSGGTATLAGAVDFANGTVTTLTAGTMTFLVYDALAGDFGSFTYAQNFWTVGVTDYWISVNAPGATSYSFSIDH